MIVYALCRHYDTHGGDDTRVIGLFSTKERAYEEGIKWEKKAQVAYDKQHEDGITIPYVRPMFTGMYAGMYGSYYVKTMDIDKETI